MTLDSIGKRDAFLEETSEGDYLIYYMRAPELKLGAAATSRHPIDAYHQEFKRDTWEERSELELLVDLDRTSE